MIRSRNSDNSGAVRVQRIRWQATANGPRVRTNTGSMALGGILWNEGVVPQDGTIGPTEPSASLPSAPTELVPTAGDRSAIIAFTQESDGGSPITNYEYSIDDGITYIPLNPAISTSPITIPDLSNNTEYTIYLKAVNVVGASLPSDSITVTPRGIPDAPVFVSYLRTNVDIQISFRNGPSDGDSPITEYLYAYSSDGGSTYTDFTPIDIIDILVNPTDPTILCMLIDGLDNETAYKFKLKVANIYNQSPSSAVIDVAPVYPPGAPHLTSYVNGNTTVDVYFDASGDGGSPILNYAYSLSTDGGTTFGPFVPLTVADNVSPITITGLDNSLTYAVQLEAINLIGYSSPSNTLTGINPFNSPSAPMNLVATAGNGFIDITFDPSVIDPDTDYAVVNYQYSTNNGGAYTAFTPATTSSPVQISGLTNGTPYTIRLKGVTSSQAGEYITVQSDSVSATPATVPGPPTNLVATAGNGSVSIAFTPPNNGGSTIISYTAATSDPEGITGTGSASPITVDGLTNGVEYTFTIVATNAVGDSVPSSASDPVSPAYSITRRVFITGSNSWTAPAGVTSVEYLLVGGGGGGGGGVTTGAGGGGGGGSVQTGSLSVIPGDIYSYTVGAGGLGGTFSSTPAWAATNGLAGADTVFGTITAKGGGFGYHNFANNSSGAIGRGGNAQSGDTPTTGGSGGQYRDATTISGVRQNFGAGGGGGGAGGAGATSYTSNSDDTRGGLGGAGITSDLRDGITTITYGAGGRGADEGSNSFITSNNGGTRNGANGAAYTGNGGAAGSGGSSSNNGGSGGAGGSGIIVIVY